MTKVLGLLAIAIVVMMLVAGLAVREGRTGDVSKAYNEADKAAMEVGYDVCRRAFGTAGTMPNAENLQACFAQVQGE